MEDKIPNQIPRCPCCGLSRLATTRALHWGCKQGWFPIMEGIPNLSYYDQSLIMVRKPERGWRTCKWSPSQLSLMPPRFVLLNQRFLCSVRQCADPFHATTIDIRWNAEKERKKLNPLNGVTCNTHMHLDIRGRFPVSRHPQDPLRKMRPRKKSIIRKMTKVGAMLQVQK